MTSRQKRTKLRKPSTQAMVQVIEATSEQELVPYDVHLLERSRTQWQFGDWQGLAQIDRAALQHHPDRAKLAMLAAAGRLQTGQNAEARQFVRLANDWGVSRKLISQILVAGVYNSLGRAAAIGNQQHRALQFFEKAISIGMPGGEVALLVRARSDEQSRQIAFRNAMGVSVEHGLGSAPKTVLNKESNTNPTNIATNSVSPKKGSFDVTGENMLIRSIFLTEQSKKRWPYFLKIEEIQVSVFLHLVAETMPKKFFDIGANVGFYTLIAQKYFPKIRCVAFEPTPDTFSNLVENINLNQKEGGAQAYCVALSSNRGKIEFGDFGECSGKNGILSTSIHELKGLKSRISVLTESLDSKYGEQQGRLIVKIDTEGHEIEVIKGGREFFMKNEVVLQIETGHKENSDELDALIRSYKLNLIFRLGPDSYYSNIPNLLKEVESSQLLERANRFVIAHRWDIEKAFN